MLLQILNVVAVFLQSVSVLAGCFHPDGFAITEVMHFLAGTKSVRVSLPCVSQGLPHAKETDPTHEDPQLRETTHV